MAHLFCFKAVVLIASNGLPPLEEADRWSKELKDFLQLCTMMDPKDRPDAEELLKVDISLFLFDCDVYSNHLLFFFSMISFQM